MDDVTIRPLTMEDMDAMYKGEKYNSCEGWAVDLNGRLAGIAGVANTGMLFLAFSQFTPEALAVNRRLIVRTAFALWGRIKGLGYKKLYAFADRDLPNAPRFLKSLGFTHIESSARGEMFQWES